MIDPTARLHDPTAQSHKFLSQVVLAQQAAGRARPNPSARIGKRWKVAVEGIELKALTRRPCSTGCFIIRDQHNRPAGLARIATPENAEPVAFCSHLGTLDTIDVS
jgi:hypothetical protein